MADLWDMVQFARCHILQVIRTISQFIALLQLATVDKTERKRRNA